eukprot:TRINITY_DN30435_c0_g1_i1.p1 TRINITY_DN30435_c0_g1~~TRINITY_DN30435_c0_g1_i1.p1  ORF type:complete len:251 (+),score=32.42 TRINITY_DN30435_c0_g1_i1:69-821(+)
MPCEISFLGHQGNRLASSDVASLERSLPLLSYEYKDEVQFWGKVIGIQGDYLICQGSDGGTGLYSTDGGNRWYLVPVVDESVSEVCRKIRGNFVGDPAYGYTIGGVAVREVQRLGVFIRDCDRNVAVAPRGAFSKNEVGSIEQNLAFTGLPPSAAGRLSSYLHRPFKDTVYEPSLLKSESSVPSIDINESIAQDTPQGIWSLKLDPALGTIFGSSLLYPGAVWYHKPSTPIYGYYYFGDGQTNTDLAFML